MAVERIERRPVGEERLEALRDLFPEAFADGEVDVERLKEALAGDGAEIADDSEHYELNWPGKRAAQRQANRPPTGTLRPAPGEGVDEATTQNLLIVGDNLEVLRVLQKSYAGRVKLIYIDPPYNTGNDFIYRDDFKQSTSAYLEATRQRDFGGLLTSNPKSNGRFHSNWLSMMYPRLILGRNLLREDGYVVVSIDDGELPNLRLLLDAVFGEENFLATLVWDRNRKNDARFFSVGHDYMVVYARDKGKLGELDVVLREPKEGVDEVRALFESLRQEHGDDWPKIAGELKEFFAAQPDDDPRKPLARFNKVDARGPYRDDGDLSWPGGGGPRYEVLHPVTGKPCKLPKRGWGFPTAARFWEEYESGRIVFGRDEKSVPSLRRDLFTSVLQVMRSVSYSYAQTATQRFDAIFEGQRVFDNPKPFDDMARLVDYLSGPDDLVLDFFAGSASTAHGVWLANEKSGTHRRFIAVQLDAPVNLGVVSGKAAQSFGLLTVDAIAQERLRRVSAQLKAEGATGDFGFRVLRQDRSNVLRWTPYQGSDPAVVRDLFRGHQGLVEGWTRAGVLAEVMLLEGYPLDSSCNQSPDFQEPVYVVEHPRIEARLLVCLEPDISDDTVAKLAGYRKDVFVCLEAALTDAIKVRIADVIPRVRTL